MTRYEMLGSEGGPEYLILLAFRGPWGVYFSAKTPTVRGYGFRIRVALGPSFRRRSRAHWLPYLRMLLMRPAPDWL